MGIMSLLGWRTIRRPSLSTAYTDTITVEQSEVFGNRWRCDLLKSIQWLLLFQKISSLLLIVLRGGEASAKTLYLLLSFVVDLLLLVIEL